MEFESTNRTAMLGEALMWGDKLQKQVEVLEEALEPFALYERVLGLVENLNRERAVELRSLFVAFYAAPTSTLHDSAKFVLSQLKDDEAALIGKKTEELAIPKVLIHWRPGMRCPNSKECGFHTGGKVCGKRWGHDTDHFGLHLTEDGPCNSEGFYISKSEARCFVCDTLLG